MNPDAEPELIDEEALPWYEPESFYPVQIGDVLHSRYKVLYKIGFGSSSTVWICRDLSNDTYVCVKSMVQDYPSWARELKAYERLSEGPIIKGRVHVRELLDHFQLEYGGYEYQFFVHTPLGLCITVILGIQGRYPIGMLDKVARSLLYALEYIHYMDVVHADFQPQNLIYTLGNEIILKELEEEEIENPSRTKSHGQWKVVQHREMHGRFEDLLGPKSRITVCDFGEARTGQDVYEGRIQPSPYRAPEVFLHIPWSAHVDVWSFGCMIWECVADEPLFRYKRVPLDSTEEEPSEDEMNKIQLATMAALLGPPPPEILHASGDEAAFDYFNEDGSSKYSVMEQSLESRLANAVEGQPDLLFPTEEQAKVLLAFLRRIFEWNPAERATASELLQEPWITSISW